MSEYADGPDQRHAKHSRHARQRCSLKSGETGGAVRGRNVRRKPTAWPTHRRTTGLRRGELESATAAEGAVGRLPGGLGEDSTEAAMAGGAAVPGAVDVGQIADGLNTVQPRRVTDLRFRDTEAAASDGIGGSRGVGHQIAPETQSQ